ncbi:ferritin-like domain-containing protein [Endothiovibrio diazotrophicus]
MTDLYRLAEAALRSRDPAEKLALTREASGLWEEGALVLGGGEPAPIDHPGRPARPELVPPLKVPKRKPGSVAGRAAQIHALAHIELNAVNLAWDAVHRFRGLPRAYYDDWVQVALEEAHHFEILRDRLRELGFDYGDFAAHDGLWEMARKTAHDPMARMAMVPRVLEARALEAVPLMIAKLQRVEDFATAGLLELIMRDEIGHVAAGSRWFKHHCAARGVEAESAYRGLLHDYRFEHIKGPLNREARLAAGFTTAELDALERASA